MSKFAQNSGFWLPEANKRTDSDEIWHVSVDHVCTVSCQIWPGSVREHCYKSPQNVKFGFKNDVVRDFAHAVGFAASWRCLWFLAFHSLTTTFDLLQL